MKAALCTHYGPPEEMVVQDVPSPTAGKGQVVITVKACGVNFPDVLMIQDKYQFSPALPFSPGGEVSGLVKDVGEGVTNVKCGDKVIVSTGSGGFAEEIAGGCGALRSHARQSRFRGRVVFLRDLRHVLSCAARPRASEGRRVCWWCSAPPAASGSPRSNSARRWARAWWPRRPAKRKWRSPRSMAPMTALSIRPARSHAISKSSCPKTSSA